MSAQIARHTWRARLSPIMASMVYVTLAPAKDSIRDFRPAGSTGLIVTTSTRTLHRAWERDLLKGLPHCICCAIRVQSSAHAALAWTPDKIASQGIKGCGRMYHMLVGKHHGNTDLCCWTKALPTMTGIAAPLIANSAYTFTICIAMACASSACRFDVNQTLVPI